MKVGGNKILLWMGTKLVSIGNRMVIKYRPKIVTNITFDLINPFTMILSFTVDDIEKHQILLQGDYKEKYKEFSKLLSDNQDPTTILTYEELEHLVYFNKVKWFRKF